MKNHLLLSCILFFSSFSFSISQGIWTVKDPNFNDVILDQDSSFLVVYRNQLLLYAFDKASGTRNVMLTNGDTSYWLFETGFSETLDFTPFLYRKEHELLFRIGDIWYTSFGSEETTEVFYDNANVENEFIYNQIFEFTGLSGIDHDLGIEAIEKVSGDTLTLYHKSQTGITDTYFKELRVLKGSIAQVGPYSGSFFIGSVYDAISEVWGEVGVYRQSESDLKLLLPLGAKVNYEVNPMYYFGIQYYIDHLDNGEKRVYEYFQDVDSCMEVTNAEFPGYTVLEAINPKWPYWGSDYPLTGTRSYENIVWRGKNQNGSIRYFLRSLFGQEFEIVDLRNDNNVDFVFSDFYDDSIYYYNYADHQRGFVRTNFQNGMSVKESTAVSFDSIFKLQAYNGKAYFGRYNPQAGTIQAISKDFIDDNKYAFLEALSGERIDNPLDFSFIGDRTFVHSQTAEGVKLIVFDPEAIVAIKSGISNNLTVEISPNPSQGLIRIKVPFQDILLNEYDYLITDSKGAFIQSGKITEEVFEINLSDSPSGAYQISITQNKKILFTESLILNRV